MACFWGPDSLFGATLGVVATRVGYSGGKKPNPSYRDLGDHTEAIAIEYDPNVINYNGLLELFWSHHDPTAKCKRQYTSLIFYHDDEQKALAEKSLKEKQGKYKNPIVTEIIPASTFYDAEDYHQKYRLQGHSSLCKDIGLEGNGRLIKESFLAARLNGYVVGMGGIAQFEKELPSLGLDEKTADYVRRLVVKYEGHGMTC
ncbi:hypothetical protein AAG570_013821 [Ranatra chinensis]|uniref:peptide-methionine (S)-S-oxide reductase n=1 Tax=Ranatra chinensis TaxID=642074 RepID=A0ABD0YS15_9HEMI